MRPPPLDAHLAALLVAVGGALLGAPAARAGERRPHGPDFALDVLPVLTRAGCNAAECHGAALGQAGFKLSLFGNDHEADYLAITHEMGGRRIDRAEPAMSLLFKKPTRRLPHRGGRVLREGSEAHRTLLEWGEGGYAARTSDLRLERIEASGGPRILVRAWYSDGTERDVTRLARFSSNDDAIALVDAEGQVTLKEPGETAITARFSGHVAAVRVGRPYAVRPAAGPPVEGTAAPLAATASPGAARTAVDEHLDRAIERLGLEPSSECGDATFLRRAYLDLIGALPGPEEVRRFLAGPDRGALVDELIARPEFDVHWAYRLGQLFGASARRMGGAEAAAFLRWLKERVRQPWPETARQVLTASGLEPAAAFYRQSDDPKSLAEEVGRVFLGARWECAQCHDHPFERFRQADYFGLAAMLARVRLTDEGVVHLDRGEVVYPRTGKPAPPAFPDGTPGESDGDRRVKLADWVVARPQLREAFANRVWALLLGRGLVHSPDDFRASNPPSHPELLRELARLETLPEIVRAIARSAAYRRAGPTAANRADRRAFSHFTPRLLSAEVLADAIARATGVADSYPGRPDGTRAVELGDSSLASYTLDVCGRNRPEFEGSLAQELHLLVGEPVLSKLAGARALLDRDDRALIDEIYLRALSRFPSERERRLWTAEIASGPRDEVAEDLLWALLNSWEFRTCH